MFGLPDKLYGLSIVSWLIILCLIIFFYFIVFRNQTNTLVKEEFAENNEKKDDTTKIYNFNTAWCGYSVRFQPEWLKLEQATQDTSNIKAIDVKCDNDSNKQLCEDYEIEGFPTVVIEKNGKRKVYNGERSAGAILEEASK